MKNAAVMLTPAAELSAGRCEAAKMLFVGVHTYGWLLPPRGYQSASLGLVSRQLCWLWIRMSQFQCKCCILGLRTSFYGLLGPQGLCLHRFRILLPVRGSYGTVRANEHQQLKNNEATRIFWSTKHLRYHFPSETLVEMLFPVMRLPLCCMTPASLFPPCILK